MNPKRSRSRDSSGERSGNEEAVSRAQQGIKKRAKKPSFYSRYGYHIVIGLFVVVCVGALVSTLMADSRKLAEIPVIESRDIENHNKYEDGYVLGPNTFFEGWMLSDAKAIVQAQLSNKPTLPRCMSSEDTTIIPEKYNFNEAFPDCNKPMHNQGNCSSSYSVIAAAAMSDRICQQTNGRKVLTLSAQAPLSCDQKKNNGCKGGSVSAVFDYAKKEGMVEEDCINYGADSEIPCPTGIASCKKHFASEYCVTSSEEGIKREIKKNGPVVAVLPVYRDFLVYADGIYKPLEGTPRFQGGQAVKVVGWGGDDVGNNYWIIENIWGESWGIAGNAHIATGQKNLYIEEFVLAVMPKIEDEPKESTESPADSMNQGASEKASGTKEDLDLDSEKK